MAKSIRATIRADLLEKREKQRKLLARAKAGDENAIEELHRLGLRKWEHKGETIIGDY